jgi:hypothetical protein
MQICYWEVAFAFVFVFVFVDVTQQ